jgi:biotin carboxyl carrier protein
MAFIIKVDNKEFKVDLKQEGKDFKVYLDGKEMKVEVAYEQGAQLTLIVDDKPFNIVLELDDQILVNDEAYSIEILDEQIQKLIKTSPKEFITKELAIKVPMPGLIIEVSVKQGDTVKAGQGLLIVEAMKMQNEMNAPRDGIVKKILVQKGQIVNSGDTLVIIE